MRKATLTRGKSTDNGTFGDFVLDNGASFKSGELAWHDNDHGTSCIPTGTYTCKIIESPEHGKCYCVFKVPNRDRIEIHAANWMGEKSKGLKCELLGCIALGLATGDVQGQFGLIGSRLAITKFMVAMDEEDFELTIKGAA